MEAAERVLNLWQRPLLSATRRPPSLLVSPPEPTLSTLPPLIFRHLLNRYLPLRDWLRLGWVSRQLRESVLRVWTDKARLIFQADVSSLAANPLAFRSYLPEDNLWPQRLYKTDSALSLHALLAQYKESYLLLCLSRDARWVQLVDTETFPDRRPIGRSLFRLFGQVQFPNMLHLDLSNTMFTLHNLEEMAASFPALAHLSIQHCLVYISRRQTLAPENDAVIRRILVGYNRARLNLNQGIKVTTNHPCYPTCCPHISNALHFASGISRDCLGHFRVPAISGRRWRRVSGLVCFRGAVEIG